MLLNTGALRVPATSAWLSNGIRPGSRPPSESTTITNTRSGSDKYSPATVNALQVLVAASVKDQPRPGHERWHRSRNEHLTWPGQRGYPGPDMDGHAGQILSSHLDLARVNASTGLEAKQLHALADGLRTPDRASRAIEGGEDAIPEADRVHPASAMNEELFASQRVVLVEQVPPAAIAQFGRVPGGFHDVGEEHRGQQAISWWRRPDPGQKLLDLSEYRVLIAKKDAVFIPWEHLKPRTRNVLRHIAAGGEILVAFAHRNQRWHMD